MKPWPGSSRRLRLPMLGSLAGWLILSGCVSNTIELEEPAEGSGATDAGDETGNSTTPGTATTPGTTTTPGTATNVDTATDTAAGVGYCAPACEISADCGQPIEDFACVDGICEYIGEIPDCDPAQCDDLGIGFCTTVDGFSQCAIPCSEGGGECFRPLMCEGFDDVGNSICIPEPCFGAAEGELCEIENFGAFGTCLDDECVCVSDAECTLDGFVCSV